MLKKDLICSERIRQARWAFNLFIFFLAIGATLASASVAFLMSGSISQEVYFVVIGSLTSAAASIHFKQLSQDANDRLDRFK